MYRGADNGYSHYGAIITEEQANILVGQYYAEFCMFNPVILDDVWVIFLGEIENCVNEDFKWVNELPVVLLIPYE